MAAITICSDFGALQNKVWHCFHCFPSICHEVMGPDAIIFVFWMLSFKPTFDVRYQVGSWVLRIENFTPQLQSACKESACNAADSGLIPGLGRSLGKGNGNSLQYSCLENFMDRGSWQGTVHGIPKSGTYLSFHFHNSKHQPSSTIFLISWT